MNAWQETPYGRIECEWKCENGRRAVRCAIPAGTAARVVLEGAKAGGLKASAETADSVETETGVEIRLGSGEYEFEW